MTLLDLLLKLLIAVLVVWIGEKILSIFPINAEIKNALNVILIILVVLWVIFGNLFLPLH